MQQQQKKAQLYPCILCASSFTRKTHLTRHVRSTHLKQCVYSCALCGGRAAFARRDLLTRHARRCGGAGGVGVGPGASAGEGGGGGGGGGGALSSSSSSSSVRRRACGACVRRKVRCDRVHPACVRCVARGEECVYVAMGGNGNSSSSSSSSSGATAVGASTAWGSGVALDSVLDSGSALVRASSAGHAPAPAQATAAPAAHAVIPHSSPAYIRLSQDLDIDPSLDVNVGAFRLNSPYALSSLSPDDLFYQFQTGGDVGGGASSSSPFTATGEYSRPTSALYRPLAHPADFLFDPDFALLVPDETDDDVYLSYFYSLHCRHYPFVHLPTWSRGNAHPLLKRAMRVCGALYVLEKDEPGRHAAAKKYISDHLRGGLRQQIFRAFADTPGNDVDTQVELGLALITMQNLGLFHRCSVERGIAAACHSMMVTVLRKSSIPAFVKCWVPYLDMLGTEQAWKSWARYETAKRVMLICYLHDCLLPIFHNLPPILGDNEFDLRLPCDDNLWDAPNTQQWAEHLASISDASSCTQSGHPWTRLHGDSLQSRLAHMLDPGSPTRCTPPPLNPFASFVIIHSLLRTFHTSTRNDSRQRRRTIQYALAQWYIDRLSASAAGHAGAAAATAATTALQYSFTCIALPLYWLAQLLHAEPTLTVATNASFMGEIRFCTVKRWLKDFWPVLHDEGAMWVGAGLAGVTSTGFAYVEQAVDDLRSDDKGLLEWVPRPR